MFKKNKKQDVFMHLNHLFFNVHLLVRLDVHRPYAVCILVLSKLYQWIYKYLLLKKAAPPQQKNNTVSLCSKITHVCLEKPSLRFFLISQILLFSCPLPSIVLIVTWKQTRYTLLKDFYILTQFIRGEDREERGDWRISYV